MPGSSNPLFELKMCLQTFPQQRQGQLIENINLWLKERQIDPFYLSDDEYATYIREWYNKMMCQ